jgi:arylsulfatase
VIVAQGGIYGGFTLYVKDGRVVYEVNAFGNRTGRISSEPLEAGQTEIVVEFTPDESKLQRDPVPGRSSGPGVARLSINGKPAGETPVVNFGGTYFETLDIGSDLGTAVSPDYSSPFAFTGQIGSVKVEIK